MPQRNMGTDTGEGYYVKMYLGFVLMKYGKIHGHENNCHEGRSSYLQISKNRSPNMPHRATWRRTRVIQEAEGPEKSMGKVFIVVFIAKKG